MPDVQDFRYFTVRAEPLQPGRKTRDYSMFNRTSGDLIGTIRWYGLWRQFCFFPEDASAWSASCLADVQTAIARIEKERHDAL